MNDANELTMPDPQGRELTLEQHVRQSTLCHPSWHELDHAGYLISEVGFDGEYVRDRSEQVINAMLQARADFLRLRHEGA